MGASWWLDRVVPGLITGIPYLVVGAAGLWLNWRATKRDIKRETDVSEQRIHEHIEQRLGGGQGDGGDRAGTAG